MRKCTERREWKIVLLVVAKNEKRVERQKMFKRSQRDIKNMPGGVFMNNLQGVDTLKL